MICWVRAAHASGQVLSAQVLVAVVAVASFRLPLISPVNRSFPVEAAVAKVPDAQL